MNLIKKIFITINKIYQLVYVRLNYNDVLHCSIENISKVNGKNREKDVHNCNLITCTQSPTSKTNKQKSKRNKKQTFKNN